MEADEITLVNFQGYFSLIAVDKAAHFPSLIERKNKP
jgi:hypothetical protein